MSKKKVKKSDGKIIINIKNSNSTDGSKKKKKKTKSKKSKATNGPYQNAPYNPKATSSYSGGGSIATVPPSTINKEGYDLRSLTERIEDQKKQNQLVITNGLATTPTTTEPARSQQLTITNGPSASTSHPIKKVRKVVRKEDKPPDKIKPSAKVRELPEEGSQEYYNQMTLKDLKALALKEGYDKADIKKINKKTKSEAINQFLSFKNPKPNSINTSSFQAQEVTTGSSDQMVPPAAETNLEKAPKYDDDENINWLEDFYNNVKDEYKEITGKPFSTPPDSKNVTKRRQKQYNNPNAFSTSGLFENNDSNLSTARPNEFFIQDEEESNT